MKGQILSPLTRATTCHLSAPCHRAAPPRRASNFVSPRFALPFCKRTLPRSVMSFYRKSQPNLSLVAETSFRSTRPYGKTVPARQNYSTLARNDRRVFALQVLSVTCWSELEQDANDGENV